MVGSCETPTSQILDNITLRVDLGPQGDCLQHREKSEEQVRKTGGQELQGNVLRKDEAETSLTS